VSEHQASLADAVLAVLPQTQCTRCGYADCRAYAEAIAFDGEAINRCPPGGAEGVARLAAVTGGALLPLDPANGTEGPRRLAVIDEGWCIGCTLCLKACPVDCIVGGPKAMHTVVDAQCTGCELCIPVCPVDCISLVDVSHGRTGWEAWSAAQADEARVRHDFHRFRIERSHAEKADRQRSSAHARDAAVDARATGEAVQHADATPPTTTDDDADRKRRIVEAAMARARAQR